MEKTVDNKAPVTAGMMTGFCFERGGFVEIMLSSIEMAELLKDNIGKRYDESFQAALKVVCSRLAGKDASSIRFKAVIGKKRVAVKNIPVTI